MAANLPKTKKSSRPAVGDKPLSLIEIDSEVINKQQDDFIHPREQNKSCIKQIVVHECRQAFRIGALLFFIVALVIFGTYCLALGIINYHNCPVQRFIPVYLIFEGVLMIAALPHIVLSTDNRHHPAPSCYHFPVLCYRVFLLSWEFVFLIFGSIVVYNVCLPDFEIKSDRYCHEITYMTAFYIVTVTWVAASVLVLTMVIAAFSFLFCADYRSRVIEAFNRGTTAQMSLSSQNHRHVKANVSNI